MRACSGVRVWCGTADRETVTAMISKVPPDNCPILSGLATPNRSRLLLRFSNEGLWPLCHRAAVQLAFRAAIGAPVEEVNKIAEVVAAN